VVRVLARGTARVAPGTKKKGTERKPAGQNRFRRRPGGLPGPTLRSGQRPYATCPFPPRAVRGASPAAGGRSGPTASPSSRSPPSGSGPPSCPCCWCWGGWPWWRGT